MYTCIFTHHIHPSKANFTHAKVRWINIHFVCGCVAVQSHLIPVLLSQSPLGHVTGQAGCYPPNDICCSAPTGSGKTLAFALPIIQVCLTPNSHDALELQCIFHQQIVKQLNMLSIAPIRIHCYIQVGLIPLPEIILSHPKLACE